MTKKAPSTNNIITITYNSFFILLLLLFYYHNGTSKEEKANDVRKIVSYFFDNGIIMALFLKHNLLNFCYIK